MADTGLGDYPVAGRNTWGHTNTNTHLNTVLFTLWNSWCWCSCRLTTSVTVMVVGIEASLQHLRHFVHLIMLDEVHELPQIGLCNQRRERAITVRRKNKWWWV